MPERKAEGESTLYDQCVMLYRVFDALAEYHEKEANYKVLTGFLTEIVTQAGIPLNQYSRAMRTLNLMGCTQVLSRGARKTPSMLAVVAPPTPEAFKQIRERISTQNVPSVRKYDILEQRIKDLERRLTEHENGHYVPDGFTTID